MKSIPLILTREQPCSYLEGRLSSALFIEPSVPMTSDLYSALLEKGFRRSGEGVYRPYCSECSACLPVRLEVASFKPNRSQRRCWKRNAATHVAIKPAVFEQGHFDLYRRYQFARHADGDMAYSSAEDYIGFLASSWCRSHFVEFWVDRQLAAVAVVDQAGNALSAVYTFYEPGLAHYSLGTFAILWQIHYAEVSQSDYLYLGFWIKECRKMAYKNQFQPLEGLIDGRWVVI